MCYSTSRSLPYVSVNSPFPAAGNIRVYRHASRYTGMRNKWVHVTLASRPCVTPRQLLRVHSGLSLLQQTQHRVLSSNFVSSSPCSLSLGHLVSRHVPFLRWKKGGEDGIRTRASLIPFLPRRLRSQSASPRQGTGP